MVNQARPRYTWVLFDLGGTLFEDLPGHYSEHNQRLALRELGHERLAGAVEVKPAFARARKLADADVLRRPAYRHQELVQQHLFRGLVELGVVGAREFENWMAGSALSAQLAAVAQRYFDRQAAAVVSMARLKPRVHWMLERLAGCCQLAVVSNNSEDYLQPLVRRYRLNHWLQASLSSDELGACKPNPDIFYRTFTRLGIVDEPVLYVGDTVQFDVVGARAAGLDVALLAPPSESECAAATYVIHCLSELPVLVAS